MKSICHQETMVTSLINQSLLPPRPLRPPMQCMMAVIITTFHGETPNLVYLWTVIGKIYPSDWTTWISWPGCVNDWWVWLSVSLLFHGCMGFVHQMVWVAMAVFIVEMFKLFRGIFVQFKNVTYEIRRPKNKQTNKTRFFWKKRLGFLIRRDWFSMSELNANQLRTTRFYTVWIDVSHVKVS